jgi:hypothetical protein
VAVLHAKHADRRVALPGRCVVGRSRSCDLELVDEHVSNQHATLEWNSTHWLVRDLGSSNGTFLNGRRLAPGETATLGKGDELRFGRKPTPWVVEDDGPPTLMAVHLATGGVQHADGCYLVLPDRQRPEVGVYQDQCGRWLAEARGDPRPVSDRDVLRTGDDDLWRIHLPTSTEDTLKDSDGPLLLAHLELTFLYTRDEEHVEVRARIGGRSHALKARAHHYPLFVLARQRLADHRAGAAPSEQGWVRQDELLRMLRIEENNLHISIHRARTQIGQLGVVDAAGLVERRSGTRQIRIGVEHLELVPLDAASVQGS